MSERLRVDAAMDVTRQERRVVHGVDMREFGKVGRIKPRPIKEGSDISVERFGVMIDGEFVRNGDKQQKPVERIWTKKGQSEPLAEKRYAYAQMPDGTIELQGFEQVSRVDGRVVMQKIARAYRDDGTADKEALFMNGDLIAERRYGDVRDGRVNLLYDDYYDEEGRVKERVLFTRKEGEDIWRAQTTAYDYTDGGPREVNGDRTPFILAKEPPGLSPEETGLDFLDNADLQTWQPAKPVEDWTKMD